MKRIRRIFTSALENIIRDPGNSSNWQKLFLLPSLLLVRCSKTTLNDRIRAINDDEWLFTVGDVISNQAKTPVGRNPQKRVSQYLCAGRISKAMDIVLNGTEMAPSSEEVFAQLLSKHPQEEVDASEEILEELHSFVASPDQKTQIGKQLIHEIIGNWKALVRPGTDKLRNEHLKLLVGHHLKVQEDDETLFTDLLAEVVQLIANCEYPAEIAPALRDNEIIAIPKNQVIPDVRPIGIGATLRKLCSSCIAKKNYKLNEKRFRSHQMGLKPNGVEAIIHKLNLSIEKHPEYDVFTIDADNAFNRSNRILGLCEVKKHCPGNLPFLKSMYLCRSNGWYSGLPDGIKNIGSLHGYHQGDVLASWLYVLTNQPLLESIHEAVIAAFPEEEKEYQQLWYIDDGSIHASHQVMQVIIRYLQEKGPKYGYHINRNKGKYLIGLCESAEHSQAIRANLVQEFGLSDEIIVNHPDNNPSDIPLEEKRKLYGVKVVGSFVGTPEFIRSKLDSYLQELAVGAEKLIAHTDLQERMILFRSSFIKKPLHIFRTINPLYSQDFAAKFEEIKMKILFSILGMEANNLPALYYKVAQLSIKEGGLGLLNHSLVGKAAYVASLVSFHQQYRRILLGNVNLALIPQESVVGQFILLSKLFCGSDKLCPSVYELLESKATKVKSLQGSFTEWLHQSDVESIHNSVKVESLHWFKWVRNLTKGDGACGKWLEALPTYEKFRMTAIPYRICLRYRMYLPTINFSNGSRCICKERPVLDPYGHHLASGCFIGGHGSNTHYNLVREVNNILHYGGHATKKEEKHLFVDTLPDHPLSDDKQRGLRPDISVLNYNGFGNKLCLDVTVTASLRYHVNGTPRELSIPESAQIGKQADIAFKKKMDKYDPICKANRLGFLPIVFESNGFLHRKSVDFFHQVAENCAVDKGISTEIIFNYFLKGLSFSLQKSIAHSIQFKLSNRCSANSAFNANAILLAAEDHV